MIENFFNQFCSLEASLYIQILAVHVFVSVSSGKINALDAVLRPYSRITATSTCTFPLIHARFRGNIFNEFSKCLITKREISSARSHNISSASAINNDSSIRSPEKIGIDFASTYQPLFFFYS